MGFAKRHIKDFILNAWLPKVYAKASRQPIEPGKIVFVEAKETTIPDSFRILHDRLKADSRYCVEFVSMHQLEASSVRYYLNCADMLKEAATAEVIFLNDASNIVSCVALRPETQVIQLWHACGAFKKWGMSTAELKFGGTRESKLRHPYYENLSLVTVSSPEVVWAYAEAMNLEEHKDIIRPLGVSRTDAFFDTGFLRESRRHVGKVVPACIGKKIILYAPTFRGKVALAQGPDRLDIAAFKRALASDYVLLIKHHPFVKKPSAIPEECSDFAFDVSESLTIDELLPVADICISDYSSLVFEYSLFEKPIVFFAYDRDEYDDWRGFYYDYEELTPGPIFDENAPMIDFIAHVNERFDVEKVASFRRKFMSACDGHATERILHEVFGGHVGEQDVVA